MQIADTVVFLFVCLFFSKLHAEKPITPNNPLMTFWSSPVGVICETLPKDQGTNSYRNTSKYVDTVTFIDFYQKGHDPK